MSDTAHWTLWLYEDTEMKMEEDYLREDNEQQEQKIAELTHSYGVLSEQLHRVKDERDALRAELVDAGRLIRAAHKVLWRGGSPSEMVVYDGLDDWIKRDALRGATVQPPVVCPECGVDASKHSPTCPAILRELAK